jgi:LPS-assembly protein
MAEGEFRYLHQWLGEGALNGSFLPSDNLYNDQDRKRGSWQHRYRPSNWQISSNVNYVSDSAYFTDLGTDLNQSNTTHQERSADFNYWGGFWNLLARVQGYQTIDPLLKDIDKPYARLPQLLLTANTPNNTALQGQLLSEITHFQRNISDNSGDEINGFRLRAEPTLSYAMRKPWGFIIPSVGVQQLSYQLDGTNSSDTNITTGSFNLDTSLVLSVKAMAFCKP